MKEIIGTTVRNYLHRFIAAADYIIRFTWVVLCGLKETLNTLYSWQEKMVPKHFWEHMLS